MNNAINDQYESREAFRHADAPHILMISNHGIHQWDVIPGLPDTGGQNVFVNQFTATLADFGFRITIANRGGYPHPVTGEMRTGVHYKNGRQRIVYLEDDVDAFVRKEEMNAQTLQLADFLRRFLDEEETAVDLIISHYWDAAKVGALFNGVRRHPVKHVWVPHSLGEVKKRNVNPDRWDHLRINERIRVEQQLMAQLDGVAATSSLIRRSLIEDYGLEETLFLPPCVPTDRYHPREIGPDHEIWSFIGERVGKRAQEVQQRRIVTEISRTDTTKRKDVLIKAFARVTAAHPDALLVVSIDDQEEALAAELRGLIEEKGIGGQTAVLGYVWDELPALYAITDVYCSPSVMEGFGMSVQEAAATKVPVVGSDLIPFVTEYLLGDDVDKVNYDGASFRQGEGAIVVPADDVDGFAAALNTLLGDESLRQKMGKNGYDITIPYFTWQQMAQRFLDSIDVALPEQSS